MTSHLWIFISRGRCSSCVLSSCFEFTVPIICPLNFRNIKTMWHVVHVNVYNYIYTYIQTYIHVYTYTYSFKVERKVDQDIFYPTHRRFTILQAPLGWVIPNQVQRNPTGPWVPILLRISLRGCQRIGCSSGDPGRVRASLGDFWSEKTGVFGHITGNHGLTMGFFPMKDEKVKAGHCQDARSPFTKSSLPDCSCRFSLEKLL